MDGRQLLLLILAALDRQESDLMLLDERRLYDALETAIAQFVRAVSPLTAEINLVTVAGQRSYDLPPGFLRPKPRAHGRPGAMRYVDLSGSITWIGMASGEATFRATAEEAAIPSFWAVSQKLTAGAVISGTAAEAALQENGVSLLIGSTPFFEVSQRDRVSNLTRRTDGIVLGVTEGGAIQTAMFPRGQAAWRVGDSYAVRPASRNQVVLSHPPASTGETMTIRAVVLPPPVYADHCHLPLPPENCDAIAGQAAYLYALRTTSIKAKPVLYTLFQAEVSRAKTNRALMILQEG